ncbi:MAG: Gfo/Idh/MocA family oxidoreductase [Chloroflexi bacterium]|nr:Gfo/Idh/MocA family oxidoreductase [Chloroflexota bacterium]
MSGEAGAATEAGRGGDDGIPEIGVGVVGTGFMCQAHVNAFRTLPYMAYPPPARPRLRGVASRSLAGAQAAADRYGFERAHADWREMLADPSIQLVDNCGPNNIHAEVSIAALEAGKHVLCEKPMGRNAAESRQMRDAARRAAGKHMVAFNYRFVPAVRKARLLLEQGALGEIYHFRARYCQDWLADPEFPRAWRLQQALSGSGVLGDLGSHIVDLARFLVGEPTVVNARLKTFVSERPLPENPTERGPVDVDDAFVALVEFDNGAIGTLEATRFAVGHRNANMFEINGSKGSLRFNLERLNELEVHLCPDPSNPQPGFRSELVTEPGDPFIEWWWPVGHIIGWEHTFVHEIHHLLDAIVNDYDVAPYGATFEDGWRCDVILEAITRSAADGGSPIEIEYAP